MCRANMLLIAEDYVLEGKWRVHTCLGECYQVHGSGSQLGKPRSGEYEPLLPYILVSCGDLLCTSDSRQH